MAAEESGQQAPPVWAITSTDSWVVNMGTIIDQVQAQQRQQQDRSVSKEKGQKGYHRHSIYRVPNYIKEMTKRNAYRPQLVSFGPFHHDDEALLPMEVHKRRAVGRLVGRSGKPLLEFVHAVEEIAEQLEGAYEYLHKKKWPRKKFVKLMVTDGCFFLELMRMFQEEKEEKEKGNVCKHNDPVFSEHGYLYLKDVIISDMLVIENQLPLPLLHKLMSVAGTSYYQLDNVETGKNLVVVQKSLSTCRSRVSPAEDAAETDLKDYGKIMEQWAGFLRGTLISPTHVIDNNQVLHPLDLLHRSVRGTPGDLKWSKTKESASAMHSAMELHEAGIHFKVSDATKKACGFAGAISFENGVLCIPRIILNDIAENVLLNLMAFEQLHPVAGNEVTAFVYFIDHLITTPKEVALLRSNGIIEHTLGSDKEVAKLLNWKLTNVAVISKDSYLCNVMWKVNTHCKKPWNAWRANLMHTYFKNPWVFISLIAASLLLFATVMQTVYAGLTYYNGNNN